MQVSANDSLAKHVSSGGQQSFQMTCGLIFKFPSARWTQCVLQRGHNSFGGNMQRWSRSFLLT